MASSLHDSRVNRLFLRRAVASCVPFGQKSAKQLMPIDQRHELCELLKNRRGRGFQVPRLLTQWLKVKFVQSLEHREGTVKSLAILRQEHSYPAPVGLLEFAERAAPVAQEFRMKFKKTPVRSAVSAGAAQQI